MIPLDQAISLLEAAFAIRGLPAKRVPLRQARGRVLAADAISMTDIPPFDRATMDGWAIAGDATGAVAGDAADALPRAFRIAGVIHAGDVEVIAALAGPDAPPLAPGTAVKVMTGAPVPRGAVRVVPVEKASERAGLVEIDPAAGPLAKLPTNIAPRGEDLRAGEVAARVGERLDPLRLVNLLACGVEEVTVRAVPRVAVAATGDELVENAADLLPGRILDTNAPLLRMVLEGRGYKVTSHRAIPDQPAVTRERIAALLGQADLTILTGGVSAGDRDFVPRILCDLGLEIHFSRIALQPGKPTVLATGARGAVLALPGNPVSAFVTAHLFALPALALLEGGRARPRFVTLPLAESWRGKAGDRVRLFPARLTPDGGVTPMSYHGSGHLRALMEADGLLRLEPEWSARAQGEPVAFWPIKVKAFHAA